MRALALGLAILVHGCTTTVRAEPPPPPAAQPKADRLSDVAAEFTKGRHRTALRLLQEDPDLLNGDPRARYLGGYAWVRLHRPDLAKPLLASAAAGGFDGYPGWESTDALLARVAVVERLRPPPARDLPDDERLRAVRVFADDTPWIRAVVKALPGFVSRAREVYGNDLPPIDIHLFRSREDYTVFYHALFGVGIPTSWQNGTGDANVVTFCQADREGKPINAPGSPRALGDVLHEYSHALLNTLYGDGYLRRVPQWFDEGLSDFTACEHYKELFETSALLVRRTLARSTLPSCEDLSRRLYERDPVLRYSVARFMADEMMKGRETGVIRDILRRAAGDGDFEKAIFDATGLKPSDLRDRVIARFR